MAGPGHKLTKNVQAPPTAENPAPMFDVKGNIEIGGEVNKDATGQHLDLRNVEAKNINFGQMDDVDDEESAPSGEEKETVVATPEDNLASHEGTVAESPQVSSNASAFTSEVDASTVTQNANASPKATNPAPMFKVGGNMKIGGDVNQGSKGRHIDMRGVKAGTITFGRIGRK